MKNKITSYIFLIFALLISNSCSKDYLDVQNKNSLTVSSCFIHPMLHQNFKGFKINYYRFKYYYN